MFRGQIRALLEGPIKRLKAGPFEFENAWERATEQVGSSVPTLAAFAHRRDSGSDDLDEVLDLAEKAPVPAILAAYDATEEMVAVAGENWPASKEHRVPRSRPSPPSWRTAT
jgi:hypothetical protein